ncbi:MAG: glycyl-radical enzyme activating protein [Spirochaetia bacterium]|jgi:pyruvate formate lyase activating enzyme|nr:glycyl-radical enzyme activating protein [Spirochaetia bacterium]
MFSGIIFDIKQLAIFDGPGIRQTVFLKGCPLHCLWCHNPEGISPKPQLMVSVASCTHCGKCHAACPSPENCILCGKCIDECPLHLRHICGEVISSTALAKRLGKDADYYARYGGGITFSGGEPLLQGEFLLDVLSQIKQYHRAIETSGYANENLFREIYRNVDFIIMDIKMMDDALHRKYTGKSNMSILKNASFLLEGNKPFTIRIPCIPGINDNQGNFEETARFLSGAKNLQEVELLPYQKAAGAKYQMIGEKYMPPFDENQKVFLDTKIFSKYGIRSKIL